MNIDNMWKRWELIILVGFNKLYHKDIYAGKVEELTKRTEIACKAKLRKLEITNTISALRDDVDKLIKTDKFQAFVESVTETTPIDNNGIIDVSSKYPNTFEVMTLNKKWKYLVKSNSGEWSIHTDFPFFSESGFLDSFGDSINSEEITELFEFLDAPNGSIFIRLGEKWAKCLSIDTKLEINISGNKWIRAHFSHYDAFGNVMTFAKGRTSFTSIEDVWDTAKNWRLY